MNKQFILKAIAEMDKTSDDFAEIYSAISEKYFTFDNPDEFQKQASIVNLVLNRGEEWMIEIMGRFAQHLFEVVNQGSKAAHANFVIGGKSYFFDLYVDKKELEAVHTMLRNTVMMKTTGPMQ